MALIRSLIRRAVLAILPEENELICRLCDSIVDRHNADNNCDMNANGELRLMRQTLPTARVVFDAGANLGEWTSKALEINPDASYHCFEPNPTTCQSLRARGLPGKVKVNGFALGESEGQMQLFGYGDRGGATSSLYDRRGIGVRPQGVDVVSVVTVQDYCANEGVDRIDFLKLDVEGHELSVLKGARDLLAHGRIGIVQFEYGGTYIDARVLLRDVWDYVGGLNPDYSFYKIRPTEARLVPGYQQGLETHKYSNWAIIHDSEGEGTAAR